MTTKIYNKYIYAFFKRLIFVFAIILLTFFLTTHYLFQVLFILKEQEAMEDLSRGYITTMEYIILRGTI